MTVETRPAALESDTFSRKNSSEKEVWELFKSDRVDLTMLIEALSIQKNRFQRFKGAARSVGWLVGVSFLLGVSLAGASIFINPAPYEGTNPTLYKAVGLLGLIMKDVGLGLIVSAVAVFGFEWMSHLNQALERTDKLTLAIAEVAKIKNELGAVENLRGQLESLKTESHRYFDALSRNAQTSYSTLIEGIFSEATDASFKKPLESIFRNAIILKQSRSAFIPSYMNFLGWFLERTAQYTESLCDLSRRKQNPTFTYFPPSGRDVTSQLLGNHVDALQEGDEYLTLSNPEFWVGTSFYFFWQRTKEALNRKVSVVRVFNLSKYESMNDVSGSIRTVLLEHQKYAHSFDTYYVAFMWKKCFEEAEANLLDKISEKRKNVGLKDYIFGLFKHVEHGRSEIIRFRAIGDHISQMSLRYCGEQTEDYLILREMWKASEKDKDRPDWNIDITFS